MNPKGRFPSFVVDSSASITAEGDRDLPLQDSAKIPLDKNYFVGERPHPTGALASVALEATSASWSQPRVVGRKEFLHEFVAALNASSRRRGL